VKQASRIADWIYCLVHDKVAEIQGIREEVSLIFWMEDEEGVGRLDQAA
jgi:hypothetical protein